MFKKVVIFILFILVIINKSNENDEKRHPVVFFEPSQTIPIQKTIVLGKQFKKNDYLWVRGFSDPTGNRKKNIELSKERAEEVKRRLVERYGIKESQIVATYYGMDMAENVDNAQKRRVEIYSGSRDQIIRLADREIKNYHKENSDSDQEKISSAEDVKKTVTRRPASVINSL